MKTYIGDPGDEQKGMELIKVDNNHIDVSPQEEQPFTCGICYRVVPDEVSYCQINDCPHKVEKDD